MNIICKHADLSFSLGTLHNSEELEVAVHGMLQMQWLVGLPKRVHSYSRHGVVAARLTMEF